MTKEQQRIAIAQSCGWTCCGVVQGLHPHGLPPWLNISDYSTKQVLNHEVPIDTLPNYSENLNAMHEAEKMLDANQHTTYRAHLACMFTDHPDDGMRFAITATAAQRAEAFLRTIGKWVEL